MRTPAKNRIRQETGEMEERESLGASQIEM